MIEAKNDVIEAKFKSSGIFAIVLYLFLCLGVLYMLYILAFKVIPGKYPHNFKGGMTPGMGFVFLPFFGLLLFYLLYVLRGYAFFIKIDPDRRTISFRNILGFRNKVYDFSAFDCYLDTILSSKSGTYKTIFLIKDEKAEKIITGMYYENIDELQAGLSSIKYLGFQKNFSMKALTALLYNYNQPPE